MKINGRLITIIFLLGINISSISTEEEPQTSIENNTYAIPPQITSNAQSYIAQIMTTTDLAVSKAETQRKGIPITISDSSYIASSFIGETTISRYSGVTNFKIFTDTEDYAQSDYIADARIVLMRPLSLIPLDNFKATIMRVRQEHGIMYHIITDYTPDFEQKLIMNIELGQKRLITLLHEVNILAPLDSNRQTVPLQNSLVYFRQQENKQFEDSGYRSNTFIWTGVNLLESLTFRSST